MSRESVLALGRAAAEAGMVDACRIERRGATDTNPLTGVVTHQWVTVCEGRCEVKQASSAAGPTTVAEASRRLATAELKLPVAGSEGIRPDDRVTITACLHDTELVGRVYAVTGAHHASHRTARRIPIQEALS